MKLKELSGKTIPAIGLGCMGMSEFYGSSNDLQSVKLLHEAYDLGYRHFDTADMYGRGHNEQLLGSFLSELSHERREKIVIATKAGIVRNDKDKYAISFNNRREYLKQACEDSLKRLNIECIDLYYLHRLIPGQDVEEVISTFMELIKEGKIRTIGLCEVDAATLEKANKIHPIAALQSEYSLWTREVESSVLPMCEKLGISLVAFSPLGRGFLTGAVTKEMISEGSNDDLRSRLPRFNGDNFEKNSELLILLNEVAQSLNISKSKLALSWVLAKSENIHLIPGTRRSHYLQENFESQNIVLTAEAQSRLEKIFNAEKIFGARYPSAINPSNQR
jgi:aryl-alcohol dehydrogenase-like predicted oxidoreductase